MQSPISEIDDIPSTKSSALCSVRRSSTTAPEVIQAPLRPELDRKAQKGPEMRKFGAELRRLQEIVQDIARQYICAQLVD